MLGNDAITFLKVKGYLGHGQNSLQGQLFAKDMPIIAVLRTRYPLDYGRAES